jgi:hypothetical protein
MATEIKDSNKNPFLDYLIEHPKITKGLTYTLFVLSLIQKILGLFIFISSLVGGPVFPHQPLIGCIVGVSAIGLGVGLLIASYSLVRCVFNYFEERALHGKQKLKAPGDDLKFFLLPTCSRAKLCYQYL